MNEARQLSNSTLLLSVPFMILLFIKEKLTQMKEVWLSKSLGIQNYI